MHITFRAAAVMLIILLPSVAFAHAQLRQAEPPVGGTVHNSPAQMELTFSEAVEPRFSAVTITDAAGVQVDKHDLHVAPGDAKRLAISLGALSPGVYRVVWRATSVDTHKTEGAFVFTVAP